MFLFLANISSSFHTLETLSGIAFLHSIFSLYDEQWL